VKITVRSDALLRGARALLALRKAEALGVVSRVTPQVSELEREDFDGADQWNNFEAQMRRVLPEARFVKLDNRHRIYDTFFKVNDIDATALADPDRPRAARCPDEAGGRTAVARNRLVELARASTDPELGQLGERISRLVGSVQSEVLEAPLTPVREVFDRFPRVARPRPRPGRQVRLEWWRRHRTRPGGARRGG
jgi:hypothetical protein